MAQDDGSTTARRARVRGRVQGVFFRASAQERARTLGVTGWVRNDAGGTVTIHAEGPADAVASMVEWARDGSDFARVVGVEVEEVAPEGHDRFEVRHA